MSSPNQPITILHCSDLHFGEGFQWERLHGLVEEIEAVNPDAVIVSGDLTMRARSAQFAAAHRFLEGIKAPLLVIPGNHDVPLYNLPLRMLDPFQNYRKYIGDMGAAPLQLNGVAAYGMNTVNPMRHQQGIVRPRDLEAVEEWLRAQPAGTWKLVVTHQHFANVPHHGRPGVIPGALKILRRLSQAGAHAVLCGHTHAAHVGSSAQFFPSLERPLALIYAGTATSVRTRGLVPVNNFNLLRFHRNSFDVSGCDYKVEEAQGFEVCRHFTFDRTFFGEPEL